MSEITKLYENAGIEPKYIDACTVEDKYWQNEELANEYGTFDMYMNAKCGQQEDCTTLCSCAYTKEEYPPFTAEKQIELIKWLGKLDGKLEITCTYNKEKFIFNFYFNRETDKNPDPKYPYSNFLNADIEILIASIINDIWQDLTEEERKQIQEILE